MLNDPRNAREVQIRKMTEEIATAILIQLGRIPSDESVWNNEDEELIKKTAIAFRPLVAQNLNLDESLHELTRRFNVATLTPRPSLVRRAIGPIAFLALTASIAYLEWRDVNGDRAIYAELDRQVGNADNTRIGGTMVMQYHNNVPTLTYFQPTSAWEMLENLDGRLNALGVRVEQIENEWLPYYDNDETIGEEEREFYGNRAHYLALHQFVMTSDPDGDGIFGDKDACPDIPAFGDAPSEYDWVTQPDYSYAPYGCPDGIDVDDDSISDYRDRCLEKIPESEYEIDQGVRTGLSTDFPADQGCSLTQVRNRCTEVEWLDEKAGVVWLTNCPGEHIFRCTWKNGAYQDCSE